MNKPDISDGGIFEVMDMTSSSTGTSQFLSLCTLPNGFIFTGSTPMLLVGWENFLGLMRR
jgi:hypothetical protein